MRTLCTLIFLLAIQLTGLSQSLSYSFEGSLNPEQRQELEQKCMALPAIKSAKCRYKEDSQRGELLLELDTKDPNSRQEGDHGTFSPVDIKAILLQFLLTPLNYHSLNQ